MPFEGQIISTKNSAENFSATECLLLKILRKSQFLVYVCNSFEIPYLYKILTLKKI